jgi:hypothetical protein
MADMGAELSGGLWPEAERPLSGDCFANPAVPAAGHVGLVENNVATGAKRAQGSVFIYLFRQHCLIKH